MLKTLVAGLALASSWTWIIGMYLPRIMMERHGWAGFLAFAVPNVIGCTAFGFVLRKPGAATALRTQIEGEAKWFSSATIAFHVLFAVFLVKSLLGEDGLSVPQSEAPSPRRVLGARPSCCPSCPNPSSLGWGRWCGWAPSPCLASRPIPPSLQRPRAI